MTNKLTEQQLQEELLDEIGDFTKAITRKIGQGVGGIKGAGQKVKGAFKRAGQDIKQAYTQGRDSAQKTVAGQDYKAPQPKAKAQPQAQAPAQPQAQQTKQPGGISTALKKFGKGVADADSYNYRLGTQAQQDAQANAKKQTPAQTPAQPGTQATTATTPAAGGTQAQKRTKTGGKVAGQQSQTASAQYQRDRRAAKKQTPGQTATQVPGQKQQPSAVKQGMDKAQKPTKTAQDVGKKSGVNTAKIGGQKVDLNDPKMKGLRAAIEKAAPGVIAGVDKLQPADKAKLKKAIA